MGADGENQGKNSSPSGQATKSRKPSLRPGDKIFYWHQVGDVLVHLAEMVLRDSVMGGSQVHFAGAEAPIAMFSTSRHSSKMTQRTIVSTADHFASCGLAEVHDPCARVSSTACGQTSIAGTKSARREAIVVQVRSRREAREKGLQLVLLDNQET